MQNLIIIFFIFNSLISTSKTPLNQTRKVKTLTNFWKSTMSPKHIFDQITPIYYSKNEYH